MEEKKLLSEEGVVRQLSGEEMEQVDGGVQAVVDPNIQCPYCKKCFSNNLELIIHMKGCQTLYGGQNPQG